MRLAAKEAPVVTVAQLSHLFVMDADILNVLSAPLLSSLTIDHVQKRFQPPSFESPQDSITRFLHRSKCHLQSLSVSKAIFASGTPSGLFALEACSTISCLKLDLPPRMINGIVEALTSPSVLPNLHQLILCISQPSEDECATILSMAHSRRDAGPLKLIGVQFQDERNQNKYYLEEDMRALSGDDFEMRFERWNPPFADHVYLS